MATKPTRLTSKATKADLVREINRLQKRTDGWQNVYSGMGISGQDKRASTTFGTPMKLGEQELDDLYRGDGFGRRIVDLVANDMVREWFYVEGDTDGDTLAALKKLRYKRHLTKAIRQARLMGGAGIFMMVDDGADDPAEPLIPDRVKKIESLKVYNRYELSRLEWYQDPDEPNIGQTSVYTINPRDQASHTFNVHETRLLKIDGADVSTRVRWQSNDGWGDSVLQSAYSQLQGLASMLGSVETILGEFVIGSLTIKNLADMIAAGQEALIQKRLQQMDMAKHILNTILLDDEEIFNRESTTVSGIDKLIETVLMALSAVTGIPVTRLMGKSPAGLQATGESDTRDYYDMIAGEQEDKLQSETERLIGLIYGSSEYKGWKPKDEQDIEVVFNPLWQPTEKEVAETRKTQAETDALYIDRAVLLPEEVANSRFGGDEYSLDTTIMFERKAKTQKDIEEEEEAKKEMADAIKNAGKNGGKDDDDDGDKGVDDGNDA